jgi:integrase/recombinase XerD
MITAQLLSTFDLNDGTLRLAMAAYLARYKGQSRIHTESDLRIFRAWCSQHQLSPLQAQRPHLEICLRLR